MGYEPLGVFLGYVFDAGLVGVDVELGGIDRFGPGVDEIIKSQVEECLQVSAAFDTGSVVVSQFVGSAGPVIQDQNPAQEIPFQRYRESAIRKVASRILVAWSCEDQG